MLKVSFKPHFYEAASKLLDCNDFDTAIDVCKLDLAKVAEQFCDLHIESLHKHVSSFNDHLGACFIYKGQVRTVIEGHLVTDQMYMLVFQTAIFFSEDDSLDKYGEWLNDATTEQLASCGVDSYKFIRIDK